MHIEGGDPEITPFTAKILPPLLSMFPAF